MSDIIRLTEEVQKQLKGIGSMGDSYQDVIIRLIESHAEKVIYLPIHGDKSSKYPIGFGLTSMDEVDKFISRNPHYNSYEEIPIFDDINSGYEYLNIIEWTNK